MTATAAAIKRLDDLFQNIRLEEVHKTNRRKPKDGDHVHFNPVVVSNDCDIHGRKSSTGKTHKRNSIGPRRESMPAGLNLASASLKRKEALSSGTRSQVNLVHPAGFPSTLRKDGTTASAGVLHRDTYPKKDAYSLSKRHSTIIPNGRKEANGFSKRDYVNSSLSSGRKDSSRLSNSTDSLERNSWDPNRRYSSSGSSGGVEDPIWEENASKDKTSRQDGDGQSNGSNSNSSNGSNKPRFLPVTTLEDVQAVRCAEFHPRGNIYAVGSNSKTLRICAYPNLSDIRENHAPCQPTVLFKRTRHHKGSIYCMAWTPDGDLMATGSNDKTVKLMRFNPDTANLEGQEIELAMHDGTVRDVCFIEDTINKSSLLISGGAGDCKIYVTDCATGQPYQAFIGHSGHILSLYNWGGAVFASGSQDRTVRMWDLRARGCVNVITPVTSPNSRGSAVAAVSVEPSGRLLVSGHEDASCVLFDIRGSRTLQCFKPHTSDVRSVRFSPSAYYLLTAGYDNKLVLTDLQGDLTSSLPSVVVAQHQDKVISGRWHPAEFTFVSTSADKTATLWALPPI